MKNKRIKPSSTPSMKTGSNADHREAQAGGEAEAEGEAAGSAAATGAALMIGHMAEILKGDETMSTIKSVKVWRNPTKTETRVYVTASDGRQGCKYMTGSKWNKAGSVDGQLTTEEWAEAKRVAVWDGKWHTVTESDIAAKVTIAALKSEPKPVIVSEPIIVKPGHKVISSDGQEYRFAHMKHHANEAWFADDESMWIVVEAEQGTVDTEDGPDFGWFHTIRPATADEIAEYQRQKAEWEAKTSEERVSEMLSMFPELT